MVRNSIYVIFLILLSVTVGSCSGINDEEGSQPSLVDDGMVYVAHQGMITAPGIELDESDTEPDNSAPIIIEEFTPGDLLYFSQMPQGSNPNFEDYSEEAENYLYVYKYSPDETATWTDGYNFKVQTGHLGFNWDNVLAVGPNGNAFKFFGFHFPVDQTPVWKVQTDQTGGPNDPYNKDNFMKSDIMGAYHATSAIFTRMRFRLFHLMTYLMVTVYVPVYDGTADDYDNQSYSGFNENAMKGGYMLNAVTDFSIEWAASKSSDTEPPLVQTSSSSPKSNIKMYRHDIDETAISTITVPKYFGGAVDGIVDGEDVVRTYQFSVLFPTQNFPDDFLCFALETPGGDTKYYYFSSNQIIGADGDSFGLTQGTLQQLYLYLPRKTNQTVLVGAKILPWKDAQTDMTVNKKTNE